MNKKGESIILMIGELLAVIGVIFMTMQIATRFAKSDAVVKLQVVQDMEMMVNALVGEPGDAIVAYPTDVSMFSMILTNEKITIMVKGESELKKAIETFNLPEGFVAQGVVEEKAKVCLEKKKEVITLRECTKDES
jgi:hypothetical protein